MSLQLLQLFVTIARENQVESSWQLEVQVSCFCQRANSSNFRFLFAADGKTRQRVNEYKSLDYKFTYVTAAV